MHNINFSDTKQNKTRPKQWRQQWYNSKQQQEQHPRQQTHRQRRIQSTQIDVNRTCDRRREKEKKGKGTWI